MNTSHHPDPATLMAYAAGSLDEAFATLVSCHLTQCTSCAEHVANMEAVGGQVLESTEPAEMADGAFGRLLEKIYVDDRRPEMDTAPKAILRDKSNDTPPVLLELLGCPVSEIKWKPVAPGMWQKQLPLSENAESTLRIFRISSGKKMPDHGHGGHEMTLILQGAYSDEFGTFSKGDVADLDDHVEHQPFVVSDEDCICLIATEAPTRFKGIAGRIMQPFVGI